MSKQREGPKRHAPTPPLHEGRFAHLSGLRPMKPAREAASYVETEWAIRKLEAK